MNFFSDKNPKNLKSLMEELITHQGWDDKYKEMMIPDAWEKVTGSKIKEISSIEKFENGNLLIKIDSSTWRYEIRIRKKAFIKEMNEILGKEFIKDIKLI